MSGIDNKMQKLFDSGVRRSRSLFYGLECVNGFRRALFWSLILLFFLSLGVPLLSVTTLFAFSSVVMILFEFPTGAFADHYSRRASVLISFFLMFVSFFGFSLFQNFWILAFFFVLQDVAWTFQSGTTTAWIIDELRIGKHQKKIVSIFSWFYFFEKFGGILGGVLGFFVAPFGFRFVWLSVAVLNMVLFFILYKYMEERHFSSSPVDSKIIFHTFVKVGESLRFLFHVKSGSVRGLALAMFLVTVALTSVSVVVPLLLSGKFEMGYGYCACLSTLFGVVLLCSPFFGSFVAHRFGVRKSLVCMSIVMCVLIFLFSVASSIVSAVGILLFFYFFDTSLGTVHDSAAQFSLSSSTRASIGSLMGIVWGVGHSVGSFFTGLSIVVLGMSFTLSIVGLLFLVSAVVYVRSLKG